MVRYMDYVMFMLFFSSALCGRAEVVKWKHWEQPNKSDERVLGNHHSQPKTGSEIQVTDLCLVGLKDTNHIGFISYELRATISEETTVLWQRAIPVAKDRLRAWDVAVDEADQVVGLVLVGRTGAALFEIPLARKTKQEMDDNSGDIGHATLGGNERERLSYKKPLGRQFAMAEVQDVQLGVADGNWNLHLKLSRPRLDDVGHIENIPGLEHEIVTALLSKPIGKPQQAWKLSAHVEIEPRNAAKCYRYLRRIAASKDIYMKQHSKKVGDPLDLTVFADNFFRKGLPECPAGGTYVVGNVGDFPRCSIHGLEEDRRQFSQDKRK